MPVASIQAMEEKVGQRGPYTRVKFDRWYSAFGNQHKMLKDANVGDSFEFAVVQKGDFFNLVDLKPSDGSGGGGSAPVAAPFRASGDDWKPSMFVAYAKDLVVGDKAESLTSALDDLKAAYDYAKELNAPVPTT